MPVQEFLAELYTKDDEQSLRAFCHEKVLHGTPYCFHGKEEDWFNFKHTISDHFGIGPHEVYIVGSAMLGFSPHNRTEFSLDSDIDVAIVSPILFEDVSNMACDLEYALRDSQLHLPDYIMESYHSFLRYLSIGWIRPDKAPQRLSIGEWKNSWFDFFKSISYENCPAGNYKVAAGAFRSVERLERYTIHSFSRIQQIHQAEDLGR